MKATICILQARMGSRRLPGKTLMPLGDETVLTFILKRLQRVKAKVMVATSSEKEDDPIEQEAERLGVPAVRGDSMDVLHRFLEVLDAFPAETVVRVTGDCPFIDPGLINEAVERFDSSGADYLSNSLVRTYPKGLDVEVLRASTLREADRQAKEAAEREHVTPYIYRHPEVFTLRNLRTSHLLGKERWVIDTPEDLARIRKYVEGLGCSPEMTWLEILQRVGIRHQPKDTLRLRPAILTDEEFLLAMRNDPTTVRTSRSGRAVNPADHHEWFGRALENPATRIWIGMVGDLPIGQVRIDVVAGVGRISFSVEKVERSKGYGTQIISALVAELKEDHQVTLFEAEVHRDNLPSRRCFETNGFTTDSGNGEFIEFHRRI
ncbi:MAG: GNAT family N-acetyltransferase [Actinobacteria bacterium]|nr:GNAT family N-acetyltransferase [Actinomycetota bacterium]